MIRFYLAALIPVIFQVICIIHAIRNHKPHIWIYVIFFLPGAGSLAYFIVEVLPDIFAKDRIDKAQNFILHTLDPRKSIRQLEDAHQRSGTFENKKSLADGYFNAGRLDEAEELYRDCLKGLFATDFTVLMSLGEIALQKEDPKMLSEVRGIMETAHKDLERADLYRFYGDAYNLEGDRNKAREKYIAAVKKSPSIENLYTYSFRLKQWGEPEESAKVFNRIQDYWTHMSPAVRKTHRYWYKKAKKDLP